jgi:tetratricopeptide (TPR) repeat protein
MKLLRMVFVIVLALSCLSCITSGISNIDHYKQMTLFYTNNKNYDSALTEIDRAIAIDPSIAELYLLRGNVYRSMGRYIDAINDYTFVLDHPTGIKSDDIFLSLAAVLYRGIIYEGVAFTNDISAQHKNALSDYDKAVSILEDNRSFINSEMPQEKREACLSFEVLMYVVRAGFENERKQYDKAITHANIAIDKLENLPESPTKLSDERPSPLSTTLPGLWSTVLYARGMANLGLKRNKDALVDLKASCDLGDKDSCAEYEKLKKRMK